LRLAREKGFVWKMFGKALGGNAAAKTLLMGRIPKERLLGKRLITQWARRYFSQKNSLFIH
jgi:hypothetical protein